MIEFGLFLPVKELKGRKNLITAGSKEISVKERHLFGIVGEDTRTQQTDIRRKRPSAKVTGVRGNPRTLVVVVVVS